MPNEKRFNKRNEIWANLTEGASPRSLPTNSTAQPLKSCDDLETETLRQIWLYLETKRGDRTLLSREDIDPADLRRVLPRVGLIDVYHKPERYRIRLAGTNWQEYLGFDPTGVWLDNWPHETQKRLLVASFTAVVHAKQAMYTRRHGFIDGVQLLYEAIIVPLSADGDEVNMLLTVSTPWRADEAPSIIVGGDSGR